jgi:HK97 gp10 family phage protein
MTGIKIEGLKDLEKALTDIGPKQAINITRGAVQGLAMQVAKDIRKAATKDTKGRLKKAKNIRSKRRRLRGDIAISDILADSRDIWFWRFVEHGTQRATAQPFVNPTVESWRPKMPAEYEKQIGKRLEKAMARRK